MFTRCVTRVYILLDSHTAPCYVILCMSCIANATVRNVSWHSARKEIKSKLHRIQLETRSLDWYVKCRALLDRNGSFLIRYKITISRGTRDGRKQNRTIGNDGGRLGKILHASSYCFLFRRRRTANYATPVNSIRSNLIRSFYNRYYINYFPTFLPQAAMGTKIQEEMPGILWYRLMNRNHHMVDVWVSLQYIRFSLF